MIFDEAAAGRCYLSSLFAKTFENKGGLGGMRSISERIAVLAAQGYIKFFRNAQDYGLAPPKGSKHGYLCVEDMVLTHTLDDIDPATGELRTVPLRVLPTHYKSPLTGAVLDVENPDVWVYRDDANQEAHPDRKSTRLNSSHT